MVGTLMALSLPCQTWLFLSSLGLALFLPGASADGEAAADDEAGLADGFGGCSPVTLDLDLPGARAWADNSPKLGGAAELLRPLLGLALVAGVAVTTSSSDFFDDFPTDCEAARFGGGGGAGVTLKTHFARTSGSGVGTGGRLGPDACVEGGRVVDNCISYFAVSVFASVLASLIKPHGIPATTV